MKNFKFIPMILLLLMFFTATAPGAAALDEPSLDSKSVLLMETESRSVLFLKNENVRAYPASTTKIMTVLLAVEAVEDGRANLSDIVTASDNVNFGLIPDGSSAGIVPGEQMTLQDLLYCAMLASGNDACNVIAEYIGGSIPEFIELMNKRAEELGCTGTHFSNTNGLPDENHYTTVWDFSLISLEAISHSEFMTICDTVSYEVPATNVAEKRSLTNSNGLINDNSAIYPGYKYEYAHGVKTGYTSDAGYCLVSTAEKDGKRLLCVVMGGVVNDSNGTMTYSNFTDSKKLYEWGFNNFSFKDILTAGETVATAKVALGAGGDAVSLRPQNTLTALLPNDTQTDSFVLNVRIFDSENGGELHAPISSGDVLGEVTVMLDGISYGTVKLVAASSVDLSKMNFIKAKLGEMFSSVLAKMIVIVLVLLIAVYIVSVVNYRRRRRRYLLYMQAKREAERRRRVQAMSEASSSGREPALTTASHASEPKSEGRASDRDYFEELFKK